MAAGDGDQEAEEQFDREARTILAELEQRQSDRRDAVLAIQAGAGGQDAQDWAEQLAGMYAAWARERRLDAQVLSVQHAPGCGIRNTTMEIQQAYGLLRPEHGVHRLSHISPRDSSGRRHTSFASVEVLPVQPRTQDPGLDMQQVDIQAFRSSGPGGQHMQKSSTAVRAVHLPTGLTAVCQSERSQIQNREYALRVLAARLAARKEEEERREREITRGERQEPAFGNRIRSYVFLPRRFVRDHRTGFTHPDPEAVLAGDLDGFIQAFQLIADHQETRVG